jgi:uncharacterized membrane protein YgcG
LFYRTWIESRARALGVNGVFILLVRSPGHLEIMAGKVTRQRLFTMTDREQAVQVLREALRAGQYDDGLARVLQFIQSRLQANMGPQPATHPAPATQPAEPAPTPTPAAETAQSGPATASTTQPADYGGGTDF